MKRKRQSRDGSSEPNRTVGSPDTDVENFGPWLRQQREVRDIDQREVADASKISVRYIEALETNRFDILPAEVFTKGFLRQYAVYVGLDPEEVVNYYLAALKAQKVEEEPDPDLYPRPRSSRSSNVKWLLVAVLVGAALLSLVWLLFRMSDVDQKAGQDLVGGFSDPGVSAPAVDDEDLSEKTVAVVPAAESPVGDLEAASETPQSTESEPVAEPPATEEAPPAQGPTLDATRPPVSDAPLSLIVDFTGDCWVEATLDGSRRLAEMHVQGESLQLEAESSIEIKLGNGRAVALHLNGEPYPVQPGPGSSVVNLRFDAETSASPAVN